MSKKALAFAVGLGTGYMQGEDRKERQKREDEDRELRRQEQDMRMRESNIRLSQLQQQQADQIALRAAGAPVQDAAGGVTLPEYADSRDVGLSDGPSLANGQLRPGTAAEQNTPEGMTARQAATLQAQGRPDTAISLQNSQLNLTKSKESLEADRAKRARTLMEEGAFDVAAAARRGDAQAVFDTGNKSGQFKFKAVPTVTPEERDIPGLGKIPTFTYAGELVSPDGTTKPFKVNSHDYSTQLMPYEKQLDLQRKGTEAESKAQLRLAQGDAAMARADAAIAKADAAVAKANAAKAGRDNTGVREALSYLDGSRKELANEATEIRQTLKAELDGVISPKERKAIMEKYEPRLAEVEQRRDKLQARFSQMAARVGLTDGEPAASGKPKPAATGGVATPTSKADYDALPPGTRYRHPDGTVKIKGQK